MTEARELGFPDFRSRTSCFPPLKAVYPVVKICPSSWSTTKAELWFAWSFLA